MRKIVVVAVTAFIMVLSWLNDTTLARKASAQDEVTDTPRRGSRERSRIEQGGRSWRLFHLVLILAITMSGLSVWLRVSESQPVPSASNRARDRLGVFVDNHTPSSTWPTLTSTKASDALAWNLRVYPETTEMRAELTQVLFPQLSDLDFSSPATVVLEAPPNARLLESTRLRVGVPDSCASWFSDGEVHSVTPEVISKAPFAAYFRCTIPPTEKREDLYVEMNIGWSPVSQQEYGFSRRQYIIAREFNTSALDPENGGMYLPAPVDYSVHFAQDERLSELSMEPDGRLLDSYTWHSTKAFELAFTVEMPEHRMWTQPAIEISLLIAGVFFGLLPGLTGTKRKI